MRDDLLQTEFHLRQFAHLELLHFAGDRQRELAFLLEKDVSRHLEVRDLKTIHIVMS